MQEVTDGRSEKKRLVDQMGIKYHTNDKFITHCK